MARLLVIDDSKTQIAVITAALLAGNHQVETEFTGQAGLKRAIEDPNFDLIVLDLNLPDYGGFELNKLLKSALVTTPVIIVTSEDQLQALTPGQLKEVEYYCLKDRQLLVPKIEMVLLRHRRNSRLQPDKLT